MRTKAGVNIDKVLKPKKKKVGFGMTAVKTEGKPIMYDADYVPTTKPSVLQEAHETIYGRDRQTAYGPPKKHFALVAEYWNSHLNTRFGEEGLPAVAVTPTDVLIMMGLLKTARLAQTPDHHDSQVDAAGYFGLLERVQK